MFRRLREKIEGFLARKESERAPTADELDRLLHGMREEIINLRAQVPRLEDRARKATIEAAEWRRRAEAARRDAEAAQGRGDTEAARTALDLAERALRQAADLSRRADDARGEAVSLEAEAKEKMEQLKDAERNRDVLLARARRAGTARKLEEMLRGPESGWRRFERAEEEAEAAEDLAAATGAVDEVVSEGRSRDDIEAEFRALEDEGDVERRLEELKREVSAEERRQIEGGED